MKFNYFYKQKADEIKQGTNYYLAAVPLALQWTSLAMLNSRLIHQIPWKITRISVQGFLGISICLSLPTTLFLACVKQSDYERFGSYYNDHIFKFQGKETRFVPSYVKKMIPKLPIKLNNRSLKVIHFFANRSGDLMQVSMVISGIALSILGQTFFARGLLVGLTYGILHNYSWIPRKVHLFKETWGPLIESVGMLYTGTLFNRIYAIFQGISFFPSCEYFLQGKLDLFMSQARDPLMFDKHGEPLLIDIDKSFNRPKDLTYEEIENIKKQPYENLMSFIEKGIVAWNSPHFTNPIEVDLPGDHDFDKLLSSFKGVDWADSKRFSILERKLLAEDRFIDFIHEQLPHLTKEEIKRNISSYIEILAKKEGISNKEYAIKWVTKQMSILVDILKDKTTGKGPQQNLLYAIDICSKIVFYLEQIKKNTGKKIEYEDILLKLALEAGNYCNIGIKRAFDEIYTQILYEHFKLKQFDSDVEQFELKLLYSLEDCRYKIVAGIYQEMLHNMAKKGRG